MELTKIPHFLTLGRSTVAGDPFPRTRTGYSTKHTGYGGFPNPVRALAQAVGSRVQDNVTDMVRTHTQQTMAPTRTMTNTGFNMHRTGTIQSVNGEGARPAPYITFDAIVGRNSRFRALNKAQQDELGGVEFRVRWFSTHQCRRNQRLTGYKPFRL